MTDHAARIAAELGLTPAQVAATIELLDDGNTLPFIARYRKEATGSLDEEQLRALDRPAWSGCAPWTTGGRRCWPPSRARAS